MGRLPRASGKQIVMALKRAGFIVKRQRGSHHYLCRPGEVKIVTVAVHGEQIVPPKTLKSILEQGGLTVDELIELL